MLRSETFSHGALSKDDIKEQDLHLNESARVDGENDSIIHLLTSKYPISYSMSETLHMCNQQPIVTYQTLKPTLKRLQTELFQGCLPTFQEFVITMDETILKQCNPSKVVTVKKNFDVIWLAQDKLTEPITKTNNLLRQWGCIDINDEGSIASRSRSNMSHRSIDDLSVKMQMQTSNQTEIDD